MDADKRAAISVPATVTDRFYLITTDTHMRIAFGETVDGETTYHSAVSMLNADADALAELIERLHIKHSKGRPKI